MAEENTFFSLTDKLWNRIKTKNYFVSFFIQKTDQMPCLPTTEVKENSLDGRQSLPLFIHSTTLDDLRSGQFSYKHSGKFQEQTCL